MLLELFIRNFAIIDELKIGFDKGLNILTGETGAGKSIIIDAIQLVTGGRGSTDYIRYEENKAEIEALFDLDPRHPVFGIIESLGMEVPEDHFLLLKREILKNGKSICRVNGHLVTLSMLKEIGEWLIQIHGQHQHQHLLDEEKQLEMLDAYGQIAIQSSKQEFQSLYQRYQSMLKEVKHLTDGEKELTQRLDLLKYQINEIAQANLKLGEDEELVNQRNQIRHAEKIIKGLTDSSRILSQENGVIDLLSYVTSVLDSISSYDSKIAEIHEQLQSFYYQIEDYSMEMNRMIQQYDFNPSQIEHIEERLSTIHHLKRKYGDTVEAILEYAAIIEDEIELLEHRDHHLQKLQSDLEEIEQDLVVEALELSKLRQELAKILSDQIEKELKDLQMKDVQFKIEITYQENDHGIQVNGKHYSVSANGLDKIQFLIAPNPGEPLKPLNKIASGGELSRIMLAIQTILSHQDAISTFVFDEIDTGVSGRAAQSIAEKLSLVSRNKQIFVITHLPQVAAMGDHHYLIQKKVMKDHTFTEILRLNETERVKEIARMLGGMEITETSKKHAKEMIDQAKEHKTMLIRNIL
ncbi:DNA repair protein RecN [Tepidibacillus fermentans]|uniref:DNA repair protein RecN n=1 Tax=Tepidibacillus fermentans TaxID=1281767 RepID=A0A4R3KL32_9BACI|nr:DNA repair protein RecN [Tepidibacillus fermentans]TCS84046.1 DNA repair protein RecN (Recombination protein N) [Tepidibacillus fermentans]